MMIKLELTLDQAITTMDVLHNAIDKESNIERVYELEEVFNSLNIKIKEYGNSVSIIGYARLHFP